ncbi:MAG TPA: IclR family transcriptional regulator [Candidatus Scybalocola faecavium]|nr:IclR family transcriptional regulator [Candidatus Scybalocola faecavium]
MSGEIKSVEKAMRLLDTLAAAGTPLSLQELAIRCGCPKSTVYGLLSTLRQFHVIEQDELSGKYHLGMHLFELGNVVSSSWDVLGTARNYMPAIAQTIGETVGLWMYQDNEVICLFQQDTGNPMRVVTQAGTRFPLHCTAMGKAILTWMPDRDLKLRQLERGNTMGAFTPHTIITREGMLKEMDRIRRNGVAIENGEHFIGLRSVSAPVFDSTGFPRYALAVAGMFRSIKEENFVKAARMIWEACMKMSGDMGYMKAYPPYCLKFE